MDPFEPMLFGYPYMRLGIVLFLLPCMISGCGLLSSSAPTTPEGAASLTVVNLSDLAICDVYLAPEDDRFWGRDRLESDDQIWPNDARTFSTPAGSWNVQMKDCDGSLLLRRYDVAVRGNQRLEFRPVEVQRHRWFGARRYASSEGQPTF